MGGHKHTLLVGDLPLEEVFLGVAQGLEAVIQVAEGGLHGVLLFLYVRVGECEH